MKLGLKWLCFNYWTWCCLSCMCEGFNCTLTLSKKGWCSYWDAHYCFNLLHACVQCFLFSLYFLHFKTNVASADTLWLYVTRFILSLLSFLWIFYFYWSCSLLKGILPDILYCLHWRRYFCFKSPDLCQHLYIETWKSDLIWDCLLVS